jgi:hypothetical protein
MMIVRSGRSMSADHVSMDMWQITSADHISKDIWQTTSSKDTWHSQIMTSVKMKSTFQVRANHRSE